MPLKPENIFFLGLLNAMTELGINREDLGKIIGMDVTSVNELIDSAELGPYLEKSQLPMYVIRIHLALRGKMGKNRKDQQHWLRTENKHLKGIPIVLMNNEEGLLHVLGYLEQFGR